MNAMIPIVSLAVEHLTNEELASLNMCAQLGQSPQGRNFDYGSVAHLFTEPDGTMHTATREALAVVVNRRLSQKD
jgi:hypothetical protein